MSNEQEVNSESPEVPQQIEPQVNEKPAGYYPVDLSDLPEEKQAAIDARLSYLYSQVKRSERTIGEYRGVAQSQSNKIAELMNGMGQVVDHLEDRAYSEKEQQLNDKIRQAGEIGDLAAVTDAQAKLIDLKVKQQTSKVKPVADKKPAQEVPRVYRSAAEMASESEAAGEMTPQESMLVDTWQNERGDNGQLLRPWAFNNSSDPNRPDTNHLAALAEAAAVFNSPRFEKLNYNQKLAEIDRRMGVQQSAGRQTVMGGSLTPRAKSAKVSLTPKQQEIAIRTKYGSSKGAKSDAEYIAAFTKQVESARGARK